MLTVSIDFRQAENAFNPNVHVMNEDDLKHITTTHVSKARILPETPEYYSKQRFKEVVDAQAKLGISKDSALY